MNFFQNLQLREKIFVVCAAVAAALFLLFMLVIAPVLDRSALLDRQIRKAEQDVMSIKALSREYQQYKDTLAHLEKLISEGSDVALMTQLATLARKAGVDNHISSMTPSVNSSTAAYTEESVEVKMDNVNLDKLVAYLYEIKQPKQFLKINRLNIKPHSNDRQQLNVSFRVSVFKLNKEASS
jgi:type II secretory pathway component PulM